MAASGREADDVYQEHILEHYEEPYHRGRCLGATHAHEDDNPLCGDFIHIELKIGREGRIEQAFFQGDGCCVSQAAASMLVEHVEGRSLTDVKEFTAGKMLDLFGAKLTPNRQKCCLLCWRVLQAAMYSPVSNENRTCSTPAAPGGSTE